MAIERRAHLRLGVIRIGPCSVGLPPRADFSRTRQEPHATKASISIPMTPSMHQIADAPSNVRGQGTRHFVEGTLDPIVGLSFVLRLWH